MKFTAIFLFLSFLLSCQKEKQPNPLAGDYYEANGARVVANIAEVDGCLKMTVFDRDTDCRFSTFLDPIILISKDSGGLEWMGQAVLGTPNRKSGGRVDEIVLVVAEFSDGSVFMDWETEAGGCSKVLHLIKI